jgi:hypothetical protein
MKDFMEEWFGIFMLIFLMACLLGAIAWLDISVSNEKAQHIKACRELMTTIPQFEECIK